VRARAGRCVDGADSSVLRGVSDGNCAKDAGAEVSAAAPVTRMIAAVRLTLPSSVDAPYARPSRCRRQRPRAADAREDSTAWPALHARL